MRTSDITSGPSRRVRVHIDAIQTVTPAKETGGSSPRVIAGSGQLGREALQSRTRVVLLYRRRLEDRFGWMLAGQLKESLNVVLSEQPVLAGRLRRRDGEGGGRLEVKMNDSGVRLVQARAEMEMTEMLGEEGRDRGLEAQLAYWVDIDHQNPQFSPMFFAQLTAFRGDGYSIGINCSLLIADPVMVMTFMNRWGQIHSKMLFSKTPLFHLGQFRINMQAQNCLKTPTTTKPNTTYKTALFAATAAEEHHSVGSMASLCMKNAAKTHAGGTAPPAALTTFTVGSSGDVKVDAEVGSETGVQPNKERTDIQVVGWEDHRHLGGGQIAFQEGVFPARASCYVESFDN